MHFRSLPAAAAAITLSFAAGHAQGPVYAAARGALPDSYAALPGSAMLVIPGVGGDFVLESDGCLEQRADGTARLTALVNWNLAIDREFFVDLTFSGRIAPGNPNHPPAGSPVLQLQSNAYAPTGPVDPSAFTYYTSVTGTLRGMRAYSGAVLTVTSPGAAQRGSGANNRNANDGMFVALDVTVVSQPNFGSMVVTGPAELRVDLRQDLNQCATHIDPDSLGNGAVRTCAALPGAATDYLFIPVGGFTEFADGHAELNGVLRRPMDLADRWALSLVFTSRLDPGAAGHPPVGRPLQQLAAAAYVPGGGTIDPAVWRYYQFATGTLTGEGLNAGGSIALTENGAFQVGLGAGQGNQFFGLQGFCLAQVGQQPTNRTVTLTGPLSLNVNLGAVCILPPPVLPPNTVNVLPSVSDQPAVFTGQDLAWTESIAIGFNIIASQNPADWYRGYFTIFDNSRIEFHPPQALAPNTYDTRLLTRPGASNLALTTLTPPAAPVVRSEREITQGRFQHWVIHQGNLSGTVLSFLALSGSANPSVIPGTISLGIGDQFQSLLTFSDTFFHDPVTGAVTVRLGPMPAMVGMRLYCQAALVEASNPNLLPIRTSDVWFTDYR